MSRQFFIGDVHGCCSELEELLAQFGAVTGDAIYQVGDLLCKGPDNLGTLRFAQNAGIQMVQGNHERHLVRVWAKNPDQRTPKERAFLERLGPGVEEMALAVRDWPLWRELGSLLVVHAGLQPGQPHPREMSGRILTTIRTWDGVGTELDVPGDPPWHQVQEWPWTVVYGHWALQGLCDLPRFKGLDTGCVYGNALTGWCPQENRFYAVAARQAYASL